MATDTNGPVPMTDGAVRSVPIPSPSLVACALEKTSYEDAFAIALPPGAWSVDEVARAAIASMPAWGDRLMWVRDRIVTVFGLQRSEKLPAAGSTGPLQQGDRLGIFTVMARSENEVMFGADDKHLDFRASLLLQRNGATETAVLATVVRYNNLLGRAYFFFVRPFHRLIIGSLLRSLRRALS